MHSILTAFGFVYGSCVIFFVIRCWNSLYVSNSKSVCLYLWCLLWWIDLIHVHSLGLHTNSIHMQLSTWTCVKLVCVNCMAFMEPLCLAWFVQFIPVNCWTNLHFSFFLKPVTDYYPSVGEWLWISLTVTYSMCRNFFSHLFLACCSVHRLI